LNGEPSARARRHAAGALVFNALVWGTSWWPVRCCGACRPPLGDRGVPSPRSRSSPCAPRGAGARHACALSPVIAPGTTNAAFNWAIVIGDAVRVVFVLPDAALDRPAARVVPASG
jgi:hypothetical protein